MNFDFFFFRFFRSSASTHCLRVKGPHTCKDHQLRFQCTSDPIEIEVNHICQDDYTNLLAISMIVYNYRCVYGDL